MFVRVGPLVRATSATSVVIWAEVTHACTVSLTVEASENDKKPPLTITTRTITVGDRHYIAPQLQGLQPATWYNYQLTSTESNDTSSEVSSSTPRLQCFRTLNATEQSTNAQPLKIAYGSCREANTQVPDAFDAFGAWLLDTEEQRDEQWPQVLLLVGDQIYADEPPAEVLQRLPHIKEGAVAFEEFAQIYEHAWTCSPRIRQALAVLPTFMLFDDHEITNNWNGTPTWYADALKAGKEQMLVDGLVAYWLYQGWGNIITRDPATMPLLRIMQEAEQRGTDALPELQACIKAEIYGQTQLRWHYEIPTTPPIFVTDTRTERIAVLNGKAREIYAPGHIISQDQLATWRKHLQASSGSLGLLISSVPLLLPPVIGRAEYTMGRRLWYHLGGPFRWLGRQLARIQLQIAIKTSFDHWPLYVESWHEVQKILQEEQKNLLVLSGDVHFSYAASGDYFSSQGKAASIYQFVCTPLQNELSASDRTKIEFQSRIDAGSYGRLLTRILPLQKLWPESKISNNILYDNTLAMVTLNPRADTGYDIQQTYFGIVEGQLKPFASIALSTEK